MTARSEPGSGGASTGAFLRSRTRGLALFFIVYLFTCKGYVEVSDTHYSIETADALVTRRALDIPRAERWATLEGPDGRNYSKYGIGLPLYYVPWVAAGHVLSRAIGVPAVESIEFLVSFANLPFALLSLLLFAGCLRLLGIAEATRALMVLALGFGTLFWRYAGYDFSEMMQASLLLLAVYGVLHRTTRGVVIGGVGFAALVLVKLVHLALLPAFVGYVLARPGMPVQKRLREAGSLLLPLVAAFAFVAYMNAVRFGSPLESGYGDEAGMFFPAQLWWTVPSLLGSFDKGLFVFCPVLLLGLFGWRSFVRRHPWEAALCAALLAGNLLLAGAWHSWIGGASWGPRLLVPVISFWLLPAAFWVDERKEYRRFVAAAVLTAVSAFTQIPGVLVKDQQIHHIKRNMLTAEERPAALSDYAFAWRLVFEKLTDPGRGEVYRAATFGVPSNRELDLREHRTFHGLNLWTEHAARQFNRPVIRWLPGIGVLVIAVLAGTLWRPLVPSLARRAAARSS